MLVGRRRGLLQVRELPSGRTISGWADHQWAPIWSRAGRVFFAQGTAHAVTADGALKSRDAEEGWVVRHHFGHPIQGIAVSGDGTRIATLSQSHWARIYAVEDFQLLAEHRIRGARELIWRGEDLLVVGQGVWLLAPGEAAWPLMEGPVRDAALSQDGAKLAIASFGVGVLDIDDREWLLAESSLRRGGAASVSWHPDGQLLVVGSTAGTLEMWSLTEHQWE
jgi:WD40 repeat protein